MADIANTTVFTNGVVSCGTSDLLRQAFQEVVDDDDQDNEFVAFLRGEGDDSQTIHLTHAQASALRLTFEVDPVDETNDDITYENEENGILNDIASANNLENDETSTRQPESMETLSFTNDNENIIKVECPNLQEWTTRTLTRDECLDHETISIEDLDLSNSDDRARRQLLEQLTDGDNIPKIYVTQQNSIKTTNLNGNNHNGNEIRYAVDEKSSQNFQRNEIRDSQAQILQRLPIILPSSQFVVKPAQTILKATKNVRILPGASKITNIGVNGLHQNGTSQNSILLPKGTLINTLSPQMIKATPITTQLLNGGTISTQLLNGAQILTNCDFQGHNTNATTSNGGTIVRTTQRLGNATIPFASAIKTTGIIRGNQQFVVPTLKLNQDGGNVTKTLQTTNGNPGKTGIPGSFLKTVQIPAQMLRTANTTFVKNIPATSISKVASTTNSPLMLRTASLLKAQDTKTVPTSSTSASSLLRTTTQISSSPVSILKPQTKIHFNNTNRQTLLVSNQSVANANVTNSRFFQRTIPTTTTTTATTTCTNNEINDRNKIVQNGAKQRFNDTTLSATARVVKRAKVAGLHNPVALTAEQTDTTKPLGSSENPIQIVQQGHTFHSMQKLTQSQLKQIAHVLQQRSQEAAMPNERIVYRVVFPEELDLRMRNPGTLLKGRGGKRGRPKKTAVRQNAPPIKIPATAEDEHEDTKVLIVVEEDDRKKVVARTRSGRLSRPPRHMVRDYKHLHHLDFMQPDLDDSDGGYSDYNTNAEKLENDGASKELLSGLEVPKRKISDHFRCPTCSKIYLGRTRMARHFEMHPDHGSPEQLPPPTPDPELKRAIPQDPLKRKGKKRGPWAYVTPEAKSERRQAKLKEAISVCENSEIVKIAAKPVVNAQSLYDLMILKSDNNVRNFLSELKILVEKIRDQVGTMLKLANDEDRVDGDIMNLREEMLCDILGLDTGIYRINNDAFKSQEDNFIGDLNASIDEPPIKLQKTQNIEDSKDHLEERMSSGFSESSDLSVSDFLNDRKTDVPVNTNCPEVLMALTLMPRNSSPVIANPEVTKSNSMSKLLISNPEIQNQLSENQGFQKIDINAPKTSYRKLSSLKDGFTKLTDGLELATTTNIFEKLEGNYERSKQFETLQQAFIKLEPMEQGFKLENTTVSTYTKENSPNYEKCENGYENLETGTQNFVKGFHKLISKIVPLDETNYDETVKREDNGMDVRTGKIDGLPILQDSGPIMSNSCETSLFGSTDNLDMTKITGYDHIQHLDILTTSGVIDKHLMMDEKLVEQLHLVDQSNLVDELVSERLKNIMPDNILDNNLIPSNGNLDAELDFEALSEEFNRNTRS